MNNIITSFPQILEFAKTYTLPLAKKRAILREYLQVKILDLIYQEKISAGIYFVGGTALRLLYNLDRFSEDLDFDINHISPNQIDNLLEKISRSLHKENINLDLYKNITANRSYYELRFKDLLYKLKISENKEEKLAVKFDFETFWKKHTPEVILLNRYGFLTNIVSIGPNQMLVQKLTAYIKRAQTQGRDIYDIIWLMTQGAKLDRQFQARNNLKIDLLKEAKNKFLKERKRLKFYKLRLRPFLVNENYVEKLDLFGQLIQTL